ncbi:antitoxin [Skermania sp. ID1734]|uniref:antitoxin n=1 Tax=Skermania sp. ID1734 TaxID=2597516 RepID=UPI00117E5AF2|nr:antitoxin [Skermania sp. ID1734]TSE00093.1 antitoxin [Skermania sp. ID1734]
MAGFDDVKKTLNEHQDQVGQGLDKAGEAAKSKFDGHDDQIDKGIQKAKDALGD